MKKQSYSFPSVYEAIGTNLNFVSKDLINGLQLYDEKEQAYIIGNLALREGISPNKLVNSSPEDIDYQLLLKSGILLAIQNNNRPLAITTGFPFSTFQVYKDNAKNYIENLGAIEYNPGTYTNKEKTSMKANISQVEILPEMIGNIIALRVGDAQAEGNFFVVSLGFGTCEAVLSTESGIVHRTASSINGMQYAVDLFMRSLATKYYLGLKTEKQLDVSFRNDYIILDRQKVNIVDLRKRVLERYYTDIISTGLKKSFSDTDFERADKIFLTGGGALFPELIEQFGNEFNKIAAVEVVKNPLTLTSEGYSLNSIMLTGGDKSSAIGLDIGNANTVLTQYGNENLQANIAGKQEKIEVPNVKKENQVKDKKEGTKKESNIAEEILKKVKEKKEDPTSETSKTETKSDKVIADKVIDVVDEIVKTVRKPEEKETDETQLAELSNEEKEILSKEVNTAHKSKKEEKTNEMVDSKGSFDDYEPDFS